MNEIRRRIDEELSDLTFADIPEHRRKAARKERSMKLNKKAWAIGIAAAVAVAGTVTAGAVNGWDYSRLIKGFFPEAENNSQVSGAVQEIDTEKITNTFKNVDVSFDGALYDGNVLMVSATVRHLDGTPFEDNNYDFSKIEFPDGTHNGTGGCDLNEDGSLRVYNIMSFSNENELTTASYTFEGLRRYPDVPEWSEILDSGSMTVEFGLDNICETRSIMLTDTKNNKIEAILSPISVKLVIPESIEDCEDYRHISINGENGEIFSPADYALSSSYTDADNNTLFQIYFPRPIDINSVTSITGETFAE